jgi:hypothetical protein
MSNVNFRLWTRAQSHAVPRFAQIAHLSPVDVEPAQRSSRARRKFSRVFRSLVRSKWDVEIGEGFIYVVRYVRTGT